MVFRPMASCPERSRNQPNAAMPPKFDQIGAVQTAAGSHVRSRNSRLASFDVVGSRELDCAEARVHKPRVVAALAENARRLLSVGLQCVGRGMNLR